MPPPPKKKEKETIALFKRGERERRWFLVWRARELAASEVFFNKGKQVFSLSPKSLSLPPVLSLSLFLSFSLSVSALPHVKETIDGKKGETTGGEEGCFALHRKLKKPPPSHFFSFIFLSVFL